MTTPTKPSDAAMKAAERIFRLGVKFENFTIAELAEIIEPKPQREAMEALKAAVQDIALTYIPDSDSEKDYTPQDMVDKLNFCKRRAQEALSSLNL